MGDDEFFKRIAETEPSAEIPASDRPIGTAGRRGLSAQASKTVQRGLVGSDQEEPEEKPAEKVEAESDAAIDAPPIEDEPSLGERWSQQARRALRTARTLRTRIGAIAGAVLALALALTIVLVGVPRPGGDSTSVDRGGEGERLLSRLASVQADQRAMRVALARERTARRAELRSIAHNQDRRRGTDDSGEPAVNQQPVAPVQASSAGTTESFGFERSSP